VPVISKKDNSQLRYALYQTAIIASTRHQLSIAYFAGMLQGRERERGIRTKMRVKLAAKMLVIAWTLMKKGEPFNPEHLNLQAECNSFGERARLMTLRLQTSGGQYLGLSLNSKIWMRDDRKPYTDFAFRIVVTIRWKVRFSEGFAEKDCQKAMKYYALSSIHIPRCCFYMTPSHDHSPLDRRTIGCPPSQIMGSNRLSLFPRQTFW
jgi:hypothetical protein